MSTTRTETVTVEAGSFDLHLWVPAAGSGPGLLLLQEIFGVGPYLRAVAERLADAGYVVGAPDLFWRIAPGWAADHDQAGLEASLALMPRFEFEAAVADSLAAFGVLDSRPETRGTPGVMGFCLGGTLAFAIAAYGTPSVCVSYYGSGVPDMAGVLDQVICPTLLHFGSDDAYIPSDTVDALNGALAGRTNIALNVEIAGHAFDNHEAEMFYDEKAANAAWSKTMAFLGTHVPV